MRASPLQQLLEQDGVALTGRGEEQTCHCFSPHHEDRTPSMCVNVAKGVFLCQGCKFAGNAYTYLVDVRGSSVREAVETLKGLGWTLDQVETRRQEAASTKAVAEGRPRYVSAPYENLGNGAATKIAEHEYVTADGRAVCIVARYSRVHGKKVPKVLPFTKRSAGGWWVSGPVSNKLPDEDRVSKIPLYGLPDLQVLDLSAKPDRQVWVVEGENKVDALRTVELPSGTLVGVSLLGGSNAKIKDHDLTPLYGRRVLMSADADAVGRKYMRQLGTHLHDHGCQVRYLLPDGDDGYDVADAVYAGGWDTVKEWAANKVFPHEVKPAKVTQKKAAPAPTKKAAPAAPKTAAPAAPKTAAPAPPKTDAPAPPKTDAPAKAAPAAPKTDAPAAPKKVLPDLPPMAKTEHFRVLGYNGEHVVIQASATWRLIRIPASRMNQEGYMMQIAPLEWWRAMSDAGSWGPQVRQVQADAILRAADSMGEIDTRRKIYQRGAVRVGGDVIYNSGKNLLLPDQRGKLTVEAGFDATNAIFAPAAALNLQDDARAEHWGQEFFEVVSRYDRWRDQNVATGFLGWLTTSLIGGILDFRPMLWMTAESDTGKTFILERLVKGFAGDFLVQVASTTEAGLAQLAGSEALPHYIDEFEPLLGKEARVDDILALVRAATSGGGARVRGGQNQSFTAVYPRFSLLLASINRPKLTAADASRFFHVTLAKRQAKHWSAYKREFESAVSPMKMLALRTRIVRNATSLAARVSQIGEDMMRFPGVSTRAVEMLATLTAGAEFLSGKSVQVVRTRDSRPDNYQPLEFMFSAMIRLPSGDQITFSEVLERGYWTDIGWSHMLENECSKIAERHGFTMLNAECLAVAPSAPTLRLLLQGTPYQNIDVAEYLTTLPGSATLRTESGSPMRRRLGGKQLRLIEINPEVLRQIGFLSSGE